MVSVANNRNLTANDQNLTPVSEVSEKWGLKSSAFSERLKLLGIKPFNPGKNHP